MELERVVMQHVPAVLEAAAVGFPTPGGGPEQLHLFVVLAPNAGSTAGKGIRNGGATGCWGGFPSPWFVVLPPVLASNAARMG